mgnify:CR=1 FL=1
MSQVIGNDSLSEYEYYIEVNNMPDPFPIEEEAPLKKEQGSTSNKPKPVPISNNGKTSLNHPVPKPAILRPKNFLDESTVIEPDVTFKESLDKFKNYFQTFKQSESNELERLRKENEILKAQNAKLQEEKILIINEYEQKIKKFQLDERRLKNSPSIEADLRGTVKVEGPNQTELLLMNELRLMANQMEELKAENSQLKRSNSSLMRTSTAGFLSERKTGSLNELTEKVQLLEQDKQSLAKELEQLKAEKAQADKRLNELKLQTLEYDKINAKLQALLAERNYFEAELQKCKTALFGVEEELRRRMEERYQVVADYERRLNSLQSQLHSLKSSREAEDRLSIIGKKSDSLESSATDTSLSSIGTSPAWQNIDNITFGRLSREVPLK